MVTQQVYANAPLQVLCPLYNSLRLRELFCTLFTIHLEIISLTLLRAPKTDFACENQF